MYGDHSSAICYPGQSMRRDESRSQARNFQMLVKQIKIASTSLSAAILLSPRRIFTSGQDNTWTFFYSFSLPLKELSSQHPFALCLFVLKRFLDCTPSPTCNGL
eukprot:TRINITY_DN16262_c0_g1_i1.p1 TRINITY_DN16262_c0_g1~~TRINITY_DN16262_c0_g1_i1.p1  ORF type:complete len:104 (-),score=4.06 TRINITY_DN16262_c0_g1_i1:1-312(-)